jgi:hypothetical protein
MRDNVMGSYDVNWFLSALAQSAAAIAAIIGGFLTSVLLSLLVEGRRARDEYKSFHEEYVRHELHAADLTKQVDALQHSLYLSRIGNSLLQDEQFPWEDLVKKYEIPAELQESLRLHRDSLLVKISQLSENLWQRLMKRTKEEWDELANSVLELSQSNRRELQESLMSKVRKTYGDNSVEPMTHLTAFFKVVDERSKELQITGREEVALGKLGTQIDNYLEDIRKLEFEAIIAGDKAESAHRRLAKPIPAMVNKGFACIAFLLLTSVVLPLSLLPTSALKSKPTWHYWILVGFVLSLVLLGLYLRSLVRELRHAGSEKDHSA